jgi:hypothetical protein
MAINAPTTTSSAGSVQIPAADANAAPVSNVALWAGRILSGLISLLLVFSGVMKLMQPADVLKGFSRLGYPSGLAVGIGIVELACVSFYLVPRTSVLGAILLTGYLGGATATHVRVGDPYFGPIIIGVLVWLAIYLRDRRLRALVPWRG